MTDHSEWYTRSIFTNEFGEPSDWVIKRDSLVEYLLTINVGDVVSHTQLQEHLNVDEDEYRSLFQNAKLKLEKDHKVVLENVRGVGYRRLDNTGIVEYVEKHGRNKLRRAIRRQLRQSSAVDPMKLDPTSRSKHYQSVSVLALMRISASKSKYHTAKKAAMVDAVQTTKGPKLDWLARVHNKNTPRKE